VSVFSGNVNQSLVDLDNVKSRLNLPNVVLICVHCSDFPQGYRATVVNCFCLGGIVWQSCRVIEPFASIDEWLSVPEAAELLNVQPGRVRRLIEEHHLFSIRIDGVQKIPAHLIVNGETLPGVQGSIIVLLDSGFDLDAAVKWLYTPDSALESTPINSLIKGRKTEVRRLAQMLAL
jgi:excisionase family DNA binding protein